MSGLRNIIYDLDGTLTDTVGHFIISYRKALRSDFNDEQINVLLPNLLGHNEYSVFQHLLGERWLEGKKIFDQSEDDQLKTVSLFPGIIEAMSSFRTLGLKQFIVTGKSERNASKIIQKYNLGRFIETARYGKDQSHSKSENIADILATYRLARPETAYLGDTNRDYLAAVESAVTPLICEWGRHVAPIDYSYPASAKIFKTVDAFKGHVLSHCPGPHNES